MSVTAVPLQPTKKSHIFWLWAGLILGVLIAVALAWQGTSGVNALKGSPEQFLAWNKGQAGVKTTASGLQYKVIKPGEGSDAVDGDGVILQIHGVLRDGKEFQPAAPMQVLVGQQPLIPGFVEAIKLMNKGAHYRVWLPPSLGYGNGDGPPELKNQVLVFDIEMNEHLNAQQIQMIRMQQMMQQQQHGAGGPGGPQGVPPQ